MAEKVKPAPSPILRELSVDLERQLTKHDYGIIAQTSTCDADGEIVSLLIQDRRTGRLFRYDFAYRPACEHVPWIESLGRRRLATQSSAIYAVSDCRFSAQAQLAARRVSVNLHEVREAGQNRIVFFNCGIDGSSRAETQPWLLAQRLRGKPRRALWFGRAVLHVNGKPALEFLVWTRYETPDRLRLYIKQRRLSPTAPSLGLTLLGKRALRKVQKCYARQLGYCDKISGEHIISQSILDLFPGRLLQVYAWPGLPEGKTLESGRSSLVSNVLCKHHNELLSEVDHKALTFFRALYRALTGQVVDAEIEVDGMSIERWLLKVTCGVAAASQAQGTIAATPAEWVDILFEKAAWPPYFCSFWEPRQDENPGQVGIHVATYTDHLTGRPTALEVRTMLLTMTLVLGPFPAQRGMRRPPGITVRSARSSLGIALRWPQD